MLKAGRNKIGYGPQMMAFALKSTLVISLFVVVGIGSHPSFSCLAEAQLIRIPVNIRDPTEDVQVTISMTPIPWRGDASYTWSSASNIGSVSPSSGSGKLPLDTVSLTFSPGSGVIDYSSVQIILTITYMGSVGDRTQQIYQINFDPSYYVNVYSERGSTSGAGFYRLGTLVRPSVSPTEMIENGTMKYVLRGWSVRSASGESLTISDGDSFQVTHVMYGQAQWDVYCSVTFDGLDNKTSSWFLKGSVVTFEAPDVLQVSESVRALFSHFDLDGRMMTKENPYSLRVEKPISVIAVYKKEFHIIVSSKFGTTMGSGWYPEGSEVFPDVQPKAMSESDSVRYVFVGWDQPTPLRVYGPKLIQAIWRREFLVVIYSPLGHVNGSGWWPEGSTIRLSISETHHVFPNGTQASFEGWVVNGVPSDASFILKHPASCVAKWRYMRPMEPGNTSANTNQEENETRIFCELKVISRYSNVSGAGRYEVGSRVWVRINETEVTLSPYEKVSFMGWTSDDGSVNGNASSLEITITKDVILRAIWVRLFFFEGKWYREGEVVTLRSPPRRYVGNNSAEEFLGWYFPDEGQLLGGNLSLPVEKAILAETRFIRVHALSMYVVGVESTEVTIQEDPRVFELEIRNGTKLWFPEDSNISLTPKPTSEGLALKSIGGQNISVLRLQVRGPQSIVISYRNPSDGTHDYMVSWPIASLSSIMDWMIPFLAGASSLPLIWSLLHRRKTQKDNATLASANHEKLTFAEYVDSYFRRKKTGAERSK